MRSPDPHELYRCLFSVEAEAHRRGWDTPPTVLSLHLSERGVVSPRPSFSGLPWGGHDTATVLRRATERLRCPQADPITNALVSGLARSAWCGYLLVCECWLIKALGSQAPPEPLHVVGHREPHRHPERVEVRSVYAMIPTGVLYGVERVRGGMPVLNDVTDMTGDVPETLRTMVALTKEYAGADA